MEFTLLLGVGEAIGMVEGSTLKVWLSPWKAGLFQSEDRLRTA